MTKFIFATFLAIFASLAKADSTPIITLSPTNTLVLRTQVDEESVSRLILQLTEMPQKEVYLYINSPGGSIDAGNKLISAIKSSGKKVTCVADFAASMAFSILQSCTVRLVTESAIIMQHQGATEAKGNLTHMKQQVALLEKLTDKLHKDDAARIGMPIAKFEALIHDEWWLYGQEAPDNHVADAVTAVKCSVALSKQRETTTIDSLFGRATLTWSGCPLATYPVKVEIKMKLGVDRRDFSSWLSSLYLDQDWKTNQVVK